MAILPKIYLITLEYPPQTGGVARYYNELVKNWPGEIKVIDGRKLLWWPWPHWLSGLWRLKKMIKENNSGCLWVGQVLPLGYLAWWLKRRIGLPYVVFTHGLDILVVQKSSWKKRWLEKILRVADVVVANSEFTQKELLKLGIPNEKIVVVYPCPADLTQLTSTPGNTVLSPADAKVILSVGRLVPRKGFDQVIKILPRLLKRAPKTKYVIVGGEAISHAGYKQNLMDLARDLGVLEQVIFIEQATDAVVADWYRRATVVAMPCRQIDNDVEGFGLVFLEAAGFGKPVVAGNSGGAPETVRHGYGGFVVEPESEDELYQALLRVLTDAEFARRLGDFGKDWAAKHFQIQKEIIKLADKIAFLCPPRPSA